MTLPPGPRSQLVAMAQYFRDPLHCMVPLARRYGDPFTFPGGARLVCTGDPAGLKAIYAADPDTFAPLNADMGVFLGRHSLILTHGAEHRRARRLMTPPFHGARMRAYGGAMRRLTEQRTRAWRAGDTVAMSEVAQDISLDVILETVFGLGDPAGRAALGRLLGELIAGISPVVALVPALRREFGGVGPFAAFGRKRRALHARLDAMIAAARADAPREDVLSMLVHARDEDGAALSDEELRDQLLLLVVAGHETTAISLAWALYALHRPEQRAALERVTAELDALGPGVEPEALAKSPYLDAVCNETLRRFPLAPAPSPRRLLQPLELMGYALPAGTSVGPAIGVAHFREETFPEPFAFRPERFLGRKYSPFEFVPFGGGARRCLGAAMAAYEMRIVLGTILRSHRLRLASLRTDNGRVRAANVGPSSGVKMVVTERRA